MIKKYFLRFLFVIGLLSLAACETTAPNKNVVTNEDATSVSQAIDAGTDNDAISNDAISDDTDTTTTADKSSDTDSGAAYADQNQGVLFAILLADVNPHAGWNQVNIGNGLLYFHPEPVLDRDDFLGVSATENNGTGMVVLEMTQDGQQHLLSKTSDNPDMMLAFIIDSTLLSMIGYSEPVDSDFLAFSAGNPENAIAVAQAIAGVSGSETTENLPSTNE